MNPPGRTSRVVVEIEFDAFVRMVAVNYRHIVGALSRRLHRFGVRTEALDDRNVIIVYAGAAQIAPKRRLGHRLPRQDILLAGSVIPNQRIEERQLNALEMRRQRVMHDDGLDAEQRPNFQNVELGLFKDEADDGPQQHILDRDRKTALRHRFDMTGARCEIAKRCGPKIDADSSAPFFC